MAADGRAIPGYYFDPEKKKYFKVEKNHVAVPASRYSRESVKQIQDDSRKRKRATINHRKRRHETVERCHAISTSVASGAFLGRESGLRTRSSLQSARTHSLISGWTSGVCVDLLRRRTLGIQRPRVSCFDHDPATGGLLIGVLDWLGQGSVVSIPQTRKIQQSQQSNDGSSQSQTARQLAAVRSDISSIHITPSRNIVMTSAGGMVPPGISLAHLLDPAEADSDCMPIDSGLSTNFRFPDKETIWTSAPNPFGPPGVENVAVGSNNGVLNLHGSNWQSERVMRTDSDALALAWIGPQTLACGLRNSEVRLWDLRSKGQSLRLLHSAAVTGIKSAGTESKIVVDGLQNSLSLYDLRMASAPGRSFEKSQVPSHRGSSLGGASMPLIKFESEHHQFSTQTGLDVDMELGVVIGSGDRDSLTAFSLHNGKTIRHWRMSELLKVSTEFSIPDDGVVKCARFVQNSRGCPTVLASYESTVLELHW